MSLKYEPSSEPLLISVKQLLPTPALSYPETRTPAAPSFTLDPTPKRRWSWYVVMLVTTHMGKARVFGGGAPLELSAPFEPSGVLVLLGLAGGAWYATAGCRVQGVGCRV